MKKTTLQAIAAANEAAIIILYGRRRVGKTELIEQTYAKRNIIKLEGIEGRNEAEQRQHVLLQLSFMTQDITYAKLHVTTWTEIFELLFHLVKKGVWTRSSHSMIFSKRGRMRVFINPLFGLLRNVRYRQTPSINAMIEDVKKTELSNSWPRKHFI